MGGCKSKSTLNPNPNPKQPDTLRPSPILPLTTSHITQQVPYQWLLYNFANKALGLREKLRHQKMQSDRWTRSLTHSLTLSSVCTRAMSQAVGLISKNVPGTYPTIPSFLLRFFLSVWFLRNRRKKKEKTRFLGFSIIIFFFIIVCGISTFLKWVFMFWLFNKIFFFFSLLFVCMWVWMLVVAAKRAWEHRLVCCNTLFMGIEYPMRMLWWILCCAQSVRWNAFSSLACRFRVTPLVPEGQVCF